MNRVARTRDGYELQDKTAGHDAVGVWLPGPALCAGARERPAVLPPEIAVKLRSQQRFMNRAG